MRSIDVYGRAQVNALSAEQAVAWDRAAREAQGIPERVLMENAGRAVAGVVHARWPAGRVAAVVGAGHNGGDALVALRVLQDWGHAVEWVAAAATEPNTEVLHGRHLTRAHSSAMTLVLERATVILDGILGTGTRGAVREPAASAIAAINASGRPVVAVDLPSGVNANTGQVDGVAVQAHMVVTFGAAKVGLMLHPARAHCGDLFVAEIGFPAYAELPSAQLITPKWAHRRIPVRAANAHKGKAGRILLLAGSQGMAGAAALAAQAALRAGAGLVRIGSTAENRDALQTLVPAATFFDRTAEIPADGIHALVAGCGLGRDEPALEALERALDITDPLPALLDADALNLLAGQPGALQRIALRRPLVLTPHPGELARLSGLSESEITQQPIESALAFARAVRCTVLLKGQPSIVVADGEPTLINTTGSSDTATGGMGDQLAGVIGAFLAAGCTTRDAAALGLFYAGRAADLARRGRSLSPIDVSEHLVDAFRSPGRRHPPLRLPFITFRQLPRW